MKLILETYGKTLLEGIVVCLLLFLLFCGVKDEAGNQGIFAMTGAQVDTGGTDYGAYADFKNYALQAQRQRPVITYDDSRVPTAGSCELADYIRAFDYKGNALPIEVLACISPDGIALYPDMSVSQTTFELEIAGIYTVRVFAVDDGKRKSICEMRIPVNDIHGR